MRKQLGGLVLAGGLLGLGWWATSVEAPDIEEDLSARASAMLDDLGAEVTHEVSGRDVILRGNIASEVERRELLAAANDLAGRRVVRDEMQVVETASPYRFRAVKQDGVISEISGNYPNDEALAALGQTLPEAQLASLTRAAGVPDENWPGMVARGLDALAVIDNGTLDVTDRDIVISGRTEDPAEVEQIAQMAQDIPGSYSWVSDVIGAQAGGYSFRANKAGDEWRVAGQVPSEKSRSKLDQLINGDAALLEIVEDAPENWDAALTLGLNALGQLERGELSMTETELRLTGVAPDPETVEAVTLAGDSLPDGYSFETDVTASDTVEMGETDLTIALDAINGASVSGKAPAELDPTILAVALNVSNMSGEVEPTEGAAGETFARLNGIAGVLGHFETAEIRVSGKDISIEGQTGADSDPENVANMLRERLTESDSVTVTASDVTVNEGDMRQNAITGLNEIYTGGYWLPDIDVETTPDGCSEAVNTALGRGAITFVTGSAQLDAEARGAINEIAAIAKLCVTEGNLTLEIGGHTDSQGSEDSNQQLSQERADAVRSALVQRGVPDSIVATGYGESEPIADNNTPEGRAENRRTAFTWAQE
ncbi:OmpA family protein [Paracoccaceae bacterium GXU_MW_L88]